MAPEVTSVTKRSISSWLRLPPSRFLRIVSSTGMKEPVYNGGRVRPPGPARRNGPCGQTLHCEHFLLPAVDAPMSHRAHLGTFARERSSARRPAIQAGAEKYD